MIRRRDFVTLLGGAAMAWPLAARAQQSAVPVIGFLRGGAPALAADQNFAFLNGLRDAGYVEGQNVSIEYRWAGTQADLFPVLADELVRRRVAVLVTGALPAALAAKAATQTIPILFSVGGDPVKLGLVASYSKPGGNITGVSALNNVLATKQFEVLRESVPKAKTIAMLVNFDNPNAKNEVSDLNAVTQSLGLQLPVFNISNEREIEAAFADMVRQRVEALFVSATLGIPPDRIIAQASQDSIPAIYPWRRDAVAGGLMSYGSDQTETNRQLGVYAGRILKGSKPADLPVWEAVKVELIINMKTAKALGITFPLPLLGRADEVIE
jgi:putative ABC transport system substrate-binding protein